MKCACGCGQDIVKAKYYPQKRFCLGHRLSPKIVITSCDNCKVEIKKRFPKCYSHLKHRFCSKKCAGEFKKRKNFKKCIYCGLEFHRRGNKKSKFCSSRCCRTYYSGERHPNWTGGIEQSGRGYLATLKHNHEMADNRGRIPLHRFVMSNHLGRPLSSKEIIHHINGNKKDNRIENLQIVTRKEHVIIHAKERIKSTLKKCLVCSSDFKVYPHLKDKKKYCSYKCYWSTLFKNGSK